MQSAFGFLVFVLIAWGFSENKRGFPVRIVFVGMVLQLDSWHLSAKTAFCEERLYLP
ncbi:MAG: Na+ dependent nucleoside transporter N-terminal domain-containing protein [Desulfobacterales bacterium]